ncbi:MAG TPA: DUF2695 domain-containing protein [Ktedonobacteraceae bacterium]|nr:DUF2695 domain-containing protein [Ktedonobacteraceae bacterium]
MNALLSDAQFLELYNYLASEERLGPGPGEGKVTCDHTLRYTIAWMKAHHIQAIQTNIEKIVDLGGHCDCEILFNVDPDTWEERRKEDITGPDFMGEREWAQFLSGLLRKGGYSEGKKA